MAAKVFYEISYKDDNGNACKCKAWIKKDSYLDATNYLKRRKNVENPTEISLEKQKSRPHGKNYKNGNYNPRSKRRNACGLYKAQLNVESFITFQNLLHLFS